MLRVVGCITQEHDLGFVALACLVCLLATNTSVRLLGLPSRRRTSGRARSAPAPPSWRSASASGPPISSASWPSAPTCRSASTLPLCVLSLVLAIVATAIAFAIMRGTRLQRCGLDHRQRAYPRGRNRRDAFRRHAVLAGTGRDPLRSRTCRRFAVPGRLLLDRRHGAAGRRAAGWAAIFLTLAVAFTHFIAMGAVTLEPGRRRWPTPLAIPSSVLAMATGGCVLPDPRPGRRRLVFDQHFTGRLAAGGAPLSRRWPTQPSKV